MDFEERIIKLLKPLVKEEIILEIPKDSKFGDYSFPCFNLAKKLKKGPNQIALELKTKIKIPSFIKKTESVGPYLNFFVNEELFANEIIKQILDKQEKYGSSNIGKGKTIIIDYSSPNIAKPFSIGHLRSTIIGNSLYKIYSCLGYKCRGINHLGDWGTQFAKLIVAYNKWGNKDKLKKDPINYLFELYVKFHKEAKYNSDLEDKARACFKELEAGNKKHLALWKQFKELSLKEYKRIYFTLDIKFDDYKGESFYNTLTDKTIKDLTNKKLTEVSDGALIIPLKDIPPVLLRKSDSTTLYATRDLAALFYRINKYKPHKIIYVVGSEQKLHFNQIFKVLILFDKKFKDIVVHVPFGMIRFADKKMSTREGNIIFLDDVIKKAIKLAKETTTKKNPKLQKKDVVANAVGVGAIKYADLSSDRTKDVIFDWDNILSFEGDTGPYLQYAYVRSKAILRKVSLVKKSKIIISNPVEFELIKQLAKYPEVIEEAANHNKPHLIANYTYKLTQLFNEFYQKCPVLKVEPYLRYSRLNIVLAFSYTLKSALSLLGINTLEKM